MAGLHAVRRAASRRARRPAGRVRRTIVSRAWSWPGSAIAVAGALDQPRVDRRPLCGPFGRRPRRPTDSRTASSTRRPSAASGTSSVTRWTRPRYRCTSACGSRSCRSRRKRGEKTGSRGPQSSSAGTSASSVSPSATRSSAARLGMSRLQRDVGHEVAHRSAALGPSRTGRGAPHAPSAGSGGRDSSRGAADEGRRADARPVRGAARLRASRIRARRGPSQASGDAGVGQDDPARPDRDGARPSRARPVRPSRAPR